MTLLSTHRLIAGPDTSATEGRVRWAPSRSLWTGGMTLAAVSLAPIFVTPGAVLLFLASSAVTLCLGHSIGLHRLLIHRSLSAPLWVERVLVYLGTLVGMAGPLGMVRLHDTRDWAQRQASCHDLHAHRAPFLRDAWWQMHCRLDLTHPPRFVPEDRIVRDGFLRWLEASWMAQQIPWVILFYALGGMPWLVWGIPVRIAVSLTGHWLVGHLTHRRGPQGWAVDGVAVQGHDLPAASLVTFGEAWHGNHHAWPDSARLGIEPGQHDPGWWVLLAMRRLGLVWGLKQPGDLTPREGLHRVGTERHRHRQRGDSHPLAGHHIPTEHSVPNLGLPVTINALGHCSTLVLGSVGRLIASFVIGLASTVLILLPFDDGTILLVALGAAFIGLPFLGIALIALVIFHRSITAHLASWCIFAPVAVVAAWLAADGYQRGLGAMVHAGTGGLNGLALLVALIASMSAIVFYVVEHPKRR